MGAIIAAILGLAGGFGIAWLIIRKLPQDKIREINYERLEKEQVLAESYVAKTNEMRDTYEFEKKRIDQELLTNNSKLNEVLHQVNSLEIKRDNLNVDIKHLEQAKADAETAASIFLSQQMELATEHFDRAIEDAARKCQQDIAAYNDVCAEVMQDMVSAMSAETLAINNSIKVSKQYLDDLRHAVDVAVASAKRQEEMRQQQNFYRLIISESDMREIAQLRSVEPYLRDREALNKVIWKVYYEKPYTDMIGRVLGAGVKTGIYKITNIENQMCYVGQAVNVADRWKQHIKRGLGAETPTRNKLYPAMLEIGVENFTFELLEECSKADLDRMEDYWQEFFHAKDFGYSIK